MQPAFLHCRLPPIAVLRWKMRNWCVVVVLIATLVAQSIAQVLIPCKLWRSLFGSIYYSIVTGYFYVAWPNHANYFSFLCQLCVQAHTYSYRCASPNVPPLYPPLLPLMTCSQSRLFCQWVYNQWNDPKSGCSSDSTYPEYRHCPCFHWKHWSGHNCRKPSRGWHSTKCWFW